MNHCLMSALKTSLLSCSIALKDFFKYGPFPASFWIYFYFSWCIGTIIIGLQFSIRIGNRKEELKYCSFYDLFDRKSPTPSKNRVTIWSKKPKFVPGFEPSLLRQKAIAQPLGLPPRPLMAKLLSLGYCLAYLRLIQKCSREFFSWYWWHCLEQWTEA